MIKDLISGLSEDTLEFLKAESDFVKSLSESQAEAYHMLKQNIIAWMNSYEKGEAKDG